MIKLFLLIFIFAGAHSRRISEESKKKISRIIKTPTKLSEIFSDLLECQEYKDILKQTQCVGFSVFDPCPSKIFTYECSDVKNTGLRKKRSSFVGEDAKSGEFPHMAGIFCLCIDR